MPAYGGITRAGNAWWQGQYLPNMAGISNRTGMAITLTRIATGAGGDAPDFAVMNPADWSAVLADFMGYEMYQSRPRSMYGKDDPVNAGFRALRVLDTPIFPDPFCPLGEAFVINSRYTGLYMSEYAPMTFSGFESQIAVGQISDIGVLISCADLVCAKPSSGAQITGITGSAWPQVPGTSPAVI